MTKKLRTSQLDVRDQTVHATSVFMPRDGARQRAAERAPRHALPVMATGILVAVVATVAMTRSAHADGCRPSDNIPLLCSGTTNDSDLQIIAAKNWCDHPNGPGSPGGPCNDLIDTFLHRGDSTPPHEDWDAFFVPSGCSVSGNYDYLIVLNSNFFVNGGDDGQWIHVHNDEHYFIEEGHCAGGDGGSPPDQGAGPDAPVTSPQQPAPPPRAKSGIFAVGAGVDNASIDLLGARSNGSRFSSIVNGRHAPGFGWGGMKVVAGDFNGDGRLDIGAIGAGVDGHSVDLLVAIANGSGGYAPVANWLHADGFGWGGMMPVAGDFNGDGRWDIAAIGAGVNGTSVDLLVATSTGSSFHAFGNWRHAEGFGWGGMKPVAGDFNGDGRWDIAAIGAGVNGTSVDLLVATSTGSGFNAIANWRHAEGYGWAGMKPVAGDFNGDGRWDIGAIGDGVDPGTIDLLVALSTSSGFGQIENWLHAVGYGWGGLSPSSL